MIYIHWILAQWNSKDIISFSYHLASKISEGEEQKCLNNIRSLKGTCSDKTFLLRKMWLKLVYECFAPYMINSTPNAYKSPQYLLRLPYTHFVLHDTWPTRWGSMQNQECWLGKNLSKSEFSEKFSEFSCLVTDIQKWVIQNNSLSAPLWKLSCLSLFLLFGE